jgi:PPOX class probable F420-dependent enzyme
MAHASGAVAQRVTLSEAERAFLENPFVGVVTTLQPDGAPQSTVVWVDVDDEGVSINTAYGRVKPRNLQRDPRLSLVVVDPNDAYRWFKLMGTGRLVDEGADGQIDRLSKKYTGNDVYASRQPGERRVTVRIDPLRTLSRGLE